jgi:hypothetical protein
VLETFEIVQKKNITSYLRRTLIFSSDKCKKVAVCTVHSDRATLVFRIYGSCLWTFARAVIDLPEGLYLNRVTQKEIRVNQKIQ